jgi:hypothetical protein
MNWDPSERFDEFGSCRACVHFTPVRCPAYPRGIPPLILSGEVDHMVPRPGQQGDTVFEPMDWETWRRTGQRIPARVATAEPRP